MLHLEPSDKSQQERCWNPTEALPGDTWGLRGPQQRSPQYTGIWLCLLLTEDRPEGILLIGIQYFSCSSLLSSNPTSTKNVPFPSGPGVRPGTAQLSSGRGCLVPSVLPPATSRETHMWPVPLAFPVPTLPCCPSLCLCMGDNTALLATPWSAGWRPQQPVAWTSASGVLVTHRQDLPFN